MINNLKILLQVVINLLSTMVSVAGKTATDVIKYKSSPLTIKTSKGKMIHVTFYECDMKDFLEGYGQWTFDRINQYNTPQEIPQELLLECAMYTTGMITANPAYVISISSIRREINQDEFVVMFDKTLRDSPQFLPVLFHELGHIYFEHYNHDVKDNSPILDLSLYDEKMCDLIAQKATGKKIDLMAILPPYYKLMVQYGILDRIEAAKYTANIMKDVQKVRHY